MRKIAIHQPNFIPWLPYFYKMAMADAFVILSHVQFEKGGYQNRYKLSTGTWVTKSVNHGIAPIIDKKYSDGNKLVTLNMQWIRAIKNSLNIKTRIYHDLLNLGSHGTQRIINIVKQHNGTHYVTNPDAKDKYLDEDMVRRQGIEIEYCVVPKHLQIHTFEAFEKWGIDGTAKQLPRKEVHAELASVL